MIGIAPDDATSSTFRKITAWLRSIQAGTTFASPASTTSRTSNGSTSSCNE